MQPTISEEIAVQIENQIRQEYAGEEVYIQKKKKEERNRQLQRMFDGRNGRQVQHQLGISRATFYRALKRDQK